MFKPNIQTPLKILPKPLDLIWPDMHTGGFSSVLKRLVGASPITREIFNGNVNVDDDVVFTSATMLVL